MKNISLIVVLVIMTALAAALLQLQKYDGMELAATSRSNEQLLTMVVEMRTGVKPGVPSMTGGQIMAKIQTGQAGLQK